MPSLDRSCGQEGPALSLNSGQPTKSRGDVSPRESPQTESEDREKGNGSPEGMSSNALSLGSSVTSLVAQMVKHLPTMQETGVRSLGQEDPLEKRMAPHSSTLAWKVPWMEEPGRLLSMGRKASDTTEQLHFWGAVRQCLCLLELLIFLPITPTTDFAL